MFKVLTVYYIQYLEQMNLLKSERTMRINKEDNIFNAKNIKTKSFWFTVKKNC